MADEEEVPAPSPAADDLTAEFDAEIAARGSDPYAVLARMLDTPRRRGLAVGLEGTTIGGIRLTGVLGSGGMGITYEGVDERGDAVAVKVLSVQSEEERQRFENEWRILRALEHPGIVRYRAHGVMPDGRAWLAMDRIAGQDLEQVLVEIEEGTPGPLARVLLSGGEAAYRERICTVFAAVAEALHHAHRHGVVHRDVKPANVVLRPDLEPVVVDFGLGRELAWDTSLTRSGALIGTVGCMAPEQLEGRHDDVGPRTDVYAVGLMLYRALTGRPLREEVRDLLRDSSRRALILPRSTGGKLPRDVLGVLYGCLEPRIAHRYRDAGMLASELRRLAQRERPHRRPPSAVGRALRLGAVRAAVAVAALAAGTALAFALWPTPASVSIVALEDDQGGVLRWPDGRSTGVNLPVVDWPLPYGVHRFVYESSRLVKVEEEEAEGKVPIRIPIEVVLDRPWVRVNVLNVTQSMWDALRPKWRRYSEPDLAILDFTTHADIEVVEVDGETFPLDRLDESPYYGQLANYARIALKPGRYRVAIRDAAGNAQACDAVLRPGCFEPCVLGGRFFADVPGAVRLTWASVLSTPPDGVELELAGCAVPFMDGPGQSYIRELDPGPKTSLTEQNRNTGIVPAEPRRSAEAHLSITLPEPVRSFAVIFLAYTREALGDECTVHWRMDDGAWRDAGVEPVAPGQPPKLAIPGLVGPRSNDMVVIDRFGLPPPGVRRIEILCRMRAMQRPSGTSMVRFLGSYVNTPGHGEAAFEFVGDPDPAPRRRP